VPRLTAEVLLCHALRCERAHLYAHGDEALPELGWIHYGRYLNERLNGKPTQYITHGQEFFGREFYVNADVLIPRPETEHLVEAAIAYLRERSNTRVIDIGTGSGAIAVSVALESGIPVFASDISIRALAVAERNRRRHSARVEFFAGDILTAVRPQSLDVVLSNPPYVPSTDSANLQAEVRDWEPAIALFGGPTGFDVYARLISSAEVALKPGGRMMLELGYQSLDRVREMLAVNWTAIEVTHDLAGLPRVLGATLAIR